jgi:hypothetical protein
MSERGAFRGRGGGRGGDRGGRGGGRPGAQAGGAGGQTERPKKENILDLSKYMDKQITVKFSGGREGMRFGAVEDLRYSEGALKLTSRSHWHTQRLRPAHESCPGRGQRSSDGYVSVRGLHAHTPDAMQTRTVTSAIASSASSSHAAPSWS